MPINPELFNTLTGVPVASQAFSDAVVGPPVVGWMVELVLYGFVCSTALAYYYSPLYAKDSKRVKLMLLSVIVLETIQSGFNFYSLYHFATLQTRDVASLWHLTRMDTFSTFFLGWEGALVQIFLASRVSSLLVGQAHKQLFAFLVAIGTTVSLLGCWIYLAFTLKLHAGKLHNLVILDIATATWMWGSCGVALLISAGMFNYISRRPAGLEPQDSGLRRTFRLASELALPTAFAATMGAVLSYSLKRTHGGYNASSAFFQPLCSFYALSLLTALSCRNDIDDPIKNVASLWFAGPEEAPLPPDDQRRPRKPYRDDEKPEDAPSMEVLLTVARFREAYAVQAAEETTTAAPTPRPRARH